MKHSIIFRPKFRDIQIKIFLYFILIISILVAFILSFLIVHFYVVNEYKGVTDNLILEQKISTLTPELILSYHNLAKNINNEEKQNNYDEVNEKIEEVFSQLDSAINYEQSRIVYRGLKNLVRNIILELDQGIGDVKTGNLLTYYAYYEDASRKSNYVKEDTARLVSTDVEYAAKIQNTIQTTHKLILVIGFILLLTVTFGCLLLAFILSGKITSPLIRLSGLAKNIAGGNLELEVDEDLMKREDEIGSLSNSFNEMLKNLKKEIDSQKQINYNLNKVKQEIEQKNNELEKFNKIAVGRELKMIDLKKKLDEAEGKIQAKD